MENNKGQQIERTVKSEMLYEGRILNLRLETVELPNQKYSKREIVEHNRCICVIAVQDDHLLLVRQYRKAVDQSLLEIPAGIVEDGEKPRDAAMRELQEEIGYNCDDLEYLFDAYSSPGFTDERMSFFFAENLYESKKEADDDEFIEIVKVPIAEAYRMLSYGEFLDGKTVMGLYALKERLMKRGA